MRLESRSKAVGVGSLRKKSWGNMLEGSLAWSPEHECVGAESTLGEVERKCGCMRHNCLAKHNNKKVRDETI